VCPNSEQYESVCKGEFAEIKDSLKQIDCALRGDGGDKPGLATRLDRLEKAAENRSRLTWAAMLTLVGLLVKAGWEWIRK
jgi:hypothetical protein